MSSFRKSDNYIWSQNDVLGRGATAVVYRARSKESHDGGDVVAVKVFHDRVSNHYASVPIRELELLQRLKHRNIISILCIERESQTHNHVLAMEYCSGGSLYSMLDQPKYSFGFPEDEFMIVLSDIAEGMRYLRQQDIIHRDIKPGNIMRKIDENGGSVYKLTDFGAARQLEEEETFTSIYGTEEYLDPHMYQKAVLRTPAPGQNFGASVDIWSLGVTIYHTATGHLPYQPWGGRTNTQTMYKITTEKESGVISGVQRSENGPIEYSKELPRTCPLSSSLKSMITPLLAGLMESSIVRRLQFEEFYNSVSQIRTMTTVNIFDCNTGSNKIMYFNRKDGYAKFQDIIAGDTEIPAGDQLILYHNRELSEIIDLTIEIEMWPKNILFGQLFLYQRERFDHQRLILPDIPPLPQFPLQVALDKDAYVAHKLAAIACLIERYITKTLQQQELMQQADTHLRDFILRITRRINNCIPDMCQLLQEHRKRQLTFFGVYESFVKHLDIVIPMHKNVSGTHTSLQEIQKRIERIVKDDNPKEVLKKAENRAEECKVYMDVLMNKIMEQEKESISNCVGCLKVDNCEQKSRHLRSLIQDIWTTLVKHKKQRLLSEEEEFIHQADRSRIQTFSIQIVTVLQGHCLVNLTRTYSVVGKQISLLLKNLQRTRKVEQNITSVNECREKLSHRLDKMDQDGQKFTLEARQVMSSAMRAISLPLFSHVQNTSEPEISQVPYGSSLGMMSSHFADLNIKSLDLSQQLDNNSRDMAKTSQMLEELSHTSGYGSGSQGLSTGQVGYFRGNKGASISKPGVPTENEVKENPMGMTESGTLS